MGRSALFGQLTWATAVLTLAYSLAGLGIAVVNDFKSVEGDKALGLQSLPVVFGIKRASWISAGMIDVFQLLMVAVLIAIGQHFAAVLLVLLVVLRSPFRTSGCCATPCNSMSNIRPVPSPSWSWGCLSLHWPSAIALSPN